MGTHLFSRESYKCLVYATKYCDQLDKIALECCTYLQFIAEQGIDWHRNVHCRILSFPFKRPYYSLMKVFTKFLDNIGIIKTGRQLETFKNEIFGESGKIAAAMRTSGNTPAENKY